MTENQDEFYESPPRFLKSRNNAQKLESKLIVEKGNLVKIQTELLRLRCMVQDRKPLNILDNLIILVDKRTQELEGGINETNR